MPYYRGWLTLTPYLVTQPQDSNLCGQACVAMLTGRSLDEVIKAIGHRRGTKTRELVQVLERMGLSCPTRRLRPPSENYPIPRVALAKVPCLEKPRSNWHWIVYLNGRYVLDPAGCVTTSLVYRISSYLKVEGTKLEKELNKLEKQNAEHP